MLFSYEDKDIGRFSNMHQCAFKQKSTIARENFTEAIAEWCSVKQVFLKTWQNSLKKPTKESLF